MDWKTHKKELLKDPKVRKAIKETELEYQVAKTLIEARLKKGWSQDQLARKLKTKQSVVSRVETAKTVPTLSFLKRVAKVLDASLKIEFTYK
jgi:ribosome-binding protein aMBF1 (putative translation factor)